MRERIRKFLKKNGNSESPFVQLVEAFHRFSERIDRVKKEVRSLDGDIERIEEALLKIMERKRSEDE